jgi:hypothetical protein
MPVMKTPTRAAMNVIDDNHACEPGTFFHDLHERDTFNRTSLRRLIDAVDRISAQRARGLALDSMTATKLFDLYDSVVRGSLLAHFDPQDACRIRKLPAGRRRDWHDDLDELHNSIWSYLSGSLIPKSGTRS